MGSDSCTCKVDHSLYDQLIRRSVLTHGVTGNCTLDDNYRHLRCIIYLFNNYRWLNIRFPLFGSNVQTAKAIVYNGTLIEMQKMIVDLILHVDQGMNIMPIFNKSFKVVQVEHGMVK